MNEDKNHYTLLSLSFMLFTTFTAIAFLIVGFGTVLNKLHIENDILNIILFIPFACIGMMVFNGVAKESLRISNKFYNNKKSKLL